MNWKTKPHVHSQSNHFPHNFKTIATSTTLNFVRASVFVIQLNLKHSKVSAPSSKTKTATTQNLSSFVRIIWNVHIRVHKQLNLTNNNIHRQRRWNDWGVLKLSRLPLFPSLDDTKDPRQSSLAVGFLGYTILPFLCYISLTAQETWRN